MRPCRAIGSAARVRSAVSSFPAPSWSSAPYREGHHCGLDGPDPSYAAGALVSVIAASSPVGCGGRAVHGGILTDPTGRWRAAQPGYGWPHLRGSVMDGP